MAEPVRRVPTATHWGSYDALVEAERVVAIEPAPEDPHPSPIGAGLPAALAHPLRIRSPAVRRGWLDGDTRPSGERRGRDPFVEVGWDRALELVAAELRRVAAHHGNEAIYGGSYGWGSAGRFHHPQSQLHRFLNLHGGFTRSVNSYSCAAAEVVLPRVLGGGPWEIYDQMPTWEEIARHGGLFVAFGGLRPATAQVNAGGVGAHDAALAQRRCREAGVAFVSIAPSRGDGADPLEAQRLAPRPNTDVALMLGLAHTLVEEELADLDFLQRCCVGFERFESYLMGAADDLPKSADWAATITDVPASSIRDLARRIAASRTVIAVSWSLQRADHGEQPIWMGATLAAMSGSMGRPGGGFGVAYGGEHGLGMRRRRWHAAALPQGRNGVQAFIPVARISDMLLSPGEEIDYDGRRVRYPDIRLVYWCGGNPFHHHQDLNRLVRAWSRPETIVVHEQVWNPLARFADIVLPAAMSLERDDFAMGIKDPWIMAMHRAVAPPPRVRTDFEAFTGLADRLGFADELTEGLDAGQWVRRLYERTAELLRADQVDLPPFDEFWQLGRVRLPEPPPMHGTDALALLRADPLRHPLSTPSGRLEIFSAAVGALAHPDCPGHPVWMEPAEWLGGRLARRFPLHLLSNQPATRLHSQLDHVGPSRAAKVAGHEPLAISPRDAGRRGIRPGDVVRVFNDRGACLAGAVVDPGLRDGVVRLSTGAWYDPVEPGIPGALDRGGNPNVLTLDKGTSRLAQGPVAQTALVEVDRVAAG